MAGLRGDLSTSFSDSSSLTSSPSSSYSFSEASQTDLTSGSEGDLQAPVDEGIYGWILSLIEEEKIARFVDRCQGIYELDWQIVVSKYWFEWRRARRQSKSGSKNFKNVKFSHRTASNTLRGSLLNAYKGKGAKEFHEKKVLNSGNKTIKRWFKLPTTITHKLSKCQHKASDPTATADTPKTQHSFLSPQQDLQKEGAAFAIPSGKPISSTNFDFVDVDDKESNILLPHLFDHQQMASQTDQAGTSETPDHNCTKVESCAGSSGYDSPCGSSLENPVQEIDPREGPFKGGNTAFIFLEKAMYSRSHNKSACKVLFSVPKHGPAVEVTATLKNCFTVKVCVPRCPGLSREQLACGKVTAHVLVKTSEGRYIGETRYTYNVDLVAQLEQCVRALDDEDMELEFTGTTDEQHVALNYRLSEWESTGSHLFNLVSLRMLVFMAVKEKACNFLAAFLYSPAAPPVLQHYSEKLLSFLEYMRKSEQLAGDSSSLLVLDMCEKMLQKNTFQNKSVEKAESVTLLQANESRQSKEEYRKGYNSSSELETDQEMESLTLQTLIETKTLEPKVSGQKCDRKEITLEGKRRNVAEENDQGEVTSVQLSCSLNVESAVGSQETKLLAEWSSNKPKIYVLRKPGSPVPISRSRSSFPDPRTDVFVELQVRRMQRILEHTREASEHVLNVTEHVPVNKDQVIVDVRHSGTDQAAKDWESKYVKRVCGKIGYWFRFYKPNCELLLVFSLCDRAVPQLAVKPETKLKTQVLRVLDQATVIVETINWKGPFSKESTAVKLEFSISRPVPLVSLSRSQTSLCEIMKWLHKFCDNGLWAEFERACKNLQRQFCSADIKVAILLEKAIAFLYQHDLEKAELTALAALDKSSQAENHRLLAGRAYYYLAHVYRRERKLGEAVRCIDLSKQNLHLLDVCLDQSFMAYEEGNVMKEFISSVAVLSKKLVIEAKMCFERCLDLCKRLDDSDGSVVPTTHSFALIKIAMLLLDCGSTSGRDRCVSASYINEAKRFLDTFQRCGLDDITERRKIQFYLALSDLQYRLGNYHTALHDAEGALEKAKELGFLLEVVPARNRLCHISQRLES